MLQIFGIGFLNCMRLLTTCKLRTREDASQDSVAWCTKKSSTEWFSVVFNYSAAQFQNKHSAQKRKVSSLVNVFSCFYRERASLCITEIRFRSATNIPPSYWFTTHDSSAEVIRNWLIRLTIPIQLTAYSNWILRGSKTRLFTAEMKWKIKKTLFAYFRRCLPQKRRRWIQWNEFLIILNKLKTIGWQWSLITKKRRCHETAFY